MSAFSVFAGLSSTNSVGRLLRDPSHLRSNSVLYESDCQTHEVDEDGVSAGHLLKFEPFLDLSVIEQFSPFCFAQPLPHSPFQVRKFPHDAKLFSSFTLSPPIRSKLSMLKNPIPASHLNSYHPQGGNQPIPPLTLECHSQGFTGRDQILTEDGTTIM